MNSSSINILLLRRFLVALLPVCLMGFLLGSIFWISKRDIFQIYTIRLQGDTRFVAPETVESGLAQELRGNFLSIDLHRLRKVFLLNPWIKDVIVRRVWPNQLVVRLKAYQPIAIWGRTGQLLSDEAELFVANPAESDRHLPILEGPPGTEKEVLTQYQAFSEWFATIGVFPKVVKLSPRYAWTLSLSNGALVELGRQNNQNILYTRSMRMIKSWPMILRTWGDQIDYVDLRYTNGLAVGSAALRLSESVMPSLPKPD